MKKTKLQIVTVSNEELLVLLRKIATEQQAIVHSLTKMITNKASKADPVRVVKRIKSLQAQGVRNATLAKYSSIALGQVFLFFKEHWEDLPKRFTQAYSEGPYGYIQQVYGYGAEMTDMYTKVWLAFYSGQYKFKLPNYVRLGALPVSKLNTAASYIIRNEMTTDRWKALADETLTRSELATMLRNADDAEVDEKPAKGPKIVNTRSTTSRETGDIRMYIGGKIENVGFFNFKSTNPAVLDEIKRICGTSKIKVMR